MTKVFVVVEIQYHYTTGSRANSWIRRRMRRYPVIDFHWVGAGSYFGGRGEKAINATVDLNP